MDYPMTGGGLGLRAKAAFAGYVLCRWSIDCYEEPSLRGTEHRLWLRNRAALDGVGCAYIAPGYVSGESARG